jgi:hypothetical protein
VPVEPALVRPAPGHAPVAEAEEYVRHEVSSLRALFRDRRLSLRTMEPRLRLATGAAIASVLGTVLMIALRDIGGADVALGHTNGVVTAMSTPLFIATLVLLTIGFAYVITGAVLASPLIAVTALLVITAEIGIYTGAFGAVFGGDLYALLPDWARWSSRGLLVLIWALAITVMVVDRRRGVLPTRAVRLSVLAANMALFGGYFAILKLASPTIGHLNLFPEVISLLMLDIADLVTPLLFIAAVDFGEWGGLLGERVASALKVREGALLAPLAALGGLSLAGYGFAHAVSGDWLTWDRAWVVLRTTLILVVTIAIIIGIGRAMRLHLRHWPATLNFAALFAAVAVSIYVIAPLAGVIAGKFDGVSTPVEQVTPEGTYTSAADVTVERGGSGELAYSVLVPRGWLRQNGNTGSVTWLNGALPGEKPGQTIQGVERASVFTIDQDVTPRQLAQGLHTTIDGPVEHEAEFDVFDVTIGKQPAQLWLRPAEHGGSYILEFTVDGVPQDRVEPTWHAIAETFRTAGQPAAALENEPEPPPSEAQKSNDKFQAAVFLLTVPLAGLLLVLVGIFGRRWPPRVVGTLLLFDVVTVTTLLYFADEFGRGLFGEGTHLPYVGMAGLLAGTGILSVLALFIPWRDPERRRTLVVGLVGLQATIWALVGMGVLYEHALNASRIAVWAAVVVLVAVAWDVVMSGESMTNHGTRRLPRAARVMAFLGYVILVSATVMFYSAQTVTGTGQAAESLFEPEAITRNGLFRIAFPLAVLMFLLRFGRARGTRSGRHSQAGQDDQDDQDEPVLEPVNGWASNHSDKDV